MITLIYESLTFACDESFNLVKLNSLQIYGLWKAISIERQLSPNHVKVLNHSNGQTEMTSWEIPFITFKMSRAYWSHPQGNACYFSKQRKSHQARTLCSAACDLMWELPSRMSDMMSHNHEIFMTPWERYWEPCNWLTSAWQKLLVLFQDKWVTIHFLPGLEFFTTDYHIHHSLVLQTQKTMCFLKISN